MMHFAHTLFGICIFLTDLTLFATNFIFFLQITPIFSKNFDDNTKANPNNKGPHYPISKESKAIGLVVFFQIVFDIKHSVVVKFTDFYLA